MNGALLLATGSPLVEVDLLGALIRGGISAGVVAALLLAARRWGRELAGLLAGLPTVTGPAVVWLSLDRGHEFSAQAAHGAVAAAVPCALFALVYAWLSLNGNRVVALLGAGLASALSLPVLPLAQGPLPLLLVVAALFCASCLALMPQSLAHRQASTAEPCITPLRAGVITVLVSGAVSALASLLAPSLGPYWAGVLSSPPLLAAAVVLELHRQGCTLRVQEFLRGYLLGLVGRSVFVALFGAWLVPRGLPLALSAALAAALLLGWGSLAWMQWRGRLGPPRRASL